MKIEPKSRERLVEAALGKRKCDVAIRNVSLVNVFTGEIYPAEIGIYEGFVAHVREYPEEWGIEAETVIDGEGQYLVPGFIDPHMHIESTMMTPRNFAKAVLPLGTTAVVTDPHEIANVRGLEGIRYMVDSMRDVPLRHYVLAPSCVPALPGFENSGYEVGKEQLESILELDAVIGLAEVMDFPGVLSNSPRMRSLIDTVLERGLFVQGHALGVSGNTLSAYLCGGPVSDHETFNYEDVMERLRKGMHVDAKESTFFRNVKHTVDAVKDLPQLPRNLSFCTDDREPDGFLGQGHMNHSVNVAIGAGMEPVKAIICATLNPAREYGFANMGAVAPGYVADMFLTPRLEIIYPSKVFAAGDLVAEYGKLLVDIPTKEYELEYTDTVQLAPPTVAELRIKVSVMDGYAQVNVLQYAAIEAVEDLEIREESVTVNDGYLDISGDPDLKFIAVFNRYGLAKKTVALIRNFPLSKGAISGSVAHDSHNLVCIYTTPEEAELALRQVIEAKGGMVCIDQDRITGMLELPVCGLMSRFALDELAQKHMEVQHAARELAGDMEKNPLMEMAVIALPVRPWATITDEGLFDLRNMQILPVLVEG